MFPPTPVFGVQRPPRFFQEAAGCLQSLLLIFRGFHIFDPTPAQVLPKPAKVVRLTSDLDPIEYWVLPGEVISVYKFTNRINSRPE